MRLRVPSFALLLVLALGATAGAGPRTWYDYYYEARDKFIPAKEYQRALNDLQQAVKLKSESQIEEQTYGLEFVDYLPYFYMGKCYFALGDVDSAIRMFNIEAEKRQIQRKDALFKELARLRVQAQETRKLAEEKRNLAAEQDRVQTLTEQVRKLRAQAAEQHRAGNYDDALSDLATAQELAKPLDRGTQDAIAALTQKIRDEKKAADDRRERSRRITAALAEGGKLLEEGKPEQAKLKFDEVLGQDPANKDALEGKQRAEGDILASTTKASRDAQLAEGRRLSAAGRYEEAMRVLAAPAAEPGATEAQLLMARAMKYVQGVKKQKEVRTRVDQLLGEAEALIGGRRYADALVRLGDVLALDPDNVRAKERQRMAEQLTGEAWFDKMFPNAPPVLSFLVPSGEGKVVRRRARSRCWDSATPCSARAAGGRCATGSTPTSRARRCSRTTCSSGARSSSLASSTSCTTTA